jgi:hypothetical protein
MDGFLKTGKLGSNAGSSGFSKSKSKLDAEERRSRAPWVEK